MKRQVIKIMIGLYVLAGSVFAEAPDTVWTRTFGGADCQIYVRSMIATTDGNYIVGGTGRGYNDSVWSNPTFWATKFNDHGDAIWTRSYGDDSSHLYAQCLEAIYGGGFIMAGVTPGADPNLYVVRTYSNGDVMWDREYAGVMSSCRSITRSTTGDYFGDYFIVGDGPRQSFQVLRIGKRGVCYWVYTYLPNGDAPEYKRFIPKDICATPDGGFVVCGRVWPVNAHEPAFLLKADQYGVMEWYQEYDQHLYTFIEPREVKETRDGEYIVAGQASHDAGSSFYVLRTNAEGDKIWSGAYCLGPNSHALDVIECADGTLALIGNGFRAIKLAVGGDLLWDSQCLYKYMGAASLVSTEQGGLLLAGTMWSHPDQALVIKMAPDLIPTEVLGEETELIPGGMALTQNYPNPFNPSTTIKFSLEVRDRVSIEVFNILGRKVRTLLNEPRSAGVHSVDWDGIDQSGQAVSAGVYLYRLRTGGQVETKKMILLK